MSYLSPSLPLAAIITCSLVLSAGRLNRAYGTLRCLRCPRQLRSAANFAGRRRRGALAIPSKSTQAHAMLSTTPTRSPAPINSHDTTCGAFTTSWQHQSALTATGDALAMSISLDFVLDFISTHHASLSEFAFAQAINSDGLGDGPGLSRALYKYADELKAVLTKAQCLEAALMKEADEVRKREQGYVAEVDNLKAQLEDQRRKTVDANNLAEQHVKTTKLHQEKIQDLETKYQDLREQLKEKDSWILTVKKDVISLFAEHIEKQPRHSSEDISNSIRSILDQQPRPTLAEISSSVKDALAQQPHLSLADVSSAMKQALTDMQNIIPIKLQIDDTAFRASATSLTLQDLQAELQRRDEALLNKVHTSVGEVIKEQSGGISKGVQDVLKQVKERLPNIMSAKQEDLLRKVKNDMEKIFKDGPKNDGVGLTPDHQTAPEPRGIKRERESVTPEYSELIGLGSPLFENE